MSGPLTNTYHGVINQNPNGTYSEGGNQAVGASQFGTDNYGNPFQSAVQADAYAKADAERMKNLSNWNNGGGMTGSHPLGNTWMGLSPDEMLYQYAYAPIQMRNAMRPYLDQRSKALGYANTGQYINDYMAGGTKWNSDKAGQMYKKWTLDFANDPTKVDQRTGNILSSDWSQYQQGTPITPQIGPLPPTATGGSTGNTPPPALDPNWAPPQLGGNGQGRAIGNLPLLGPPTGMPQPVGMGMMQPFNGYKLNPGQFKPPVGN